MVLHMARVRVYAEWSILLGGVAYYAFYKYYYG
jgi:hypothetical protein